MLLLEQKIIKKGWVDENVTELNVCNNNNEEYEVKIICDSVVYARESEFDHLPRLYYLVF